MAYRVNKYGELETIPYVPQQLNPAEQAQEAGANLKQAEADKTSQNQFKSYAKGGMVQKASYAKGGAVHNKSASRFAKGHES